MFKKFKTLAILGTLAFTALSTNHVDAYRLGHDLPDSDFVVAGIPRVSNADAIRQSLGTPTSEGRFSLSYGGLTFYVSRQYYPDVITKVITNRDAATARGISVGDTIRDVYNAYGSPDKTYSKGGYDMLFYGYYTPNSGDMAGIEFATNGRYVQKITIIGSGD